MPYDAVTSGLPSNTPYPAGAATTTTALDTNTGSDWVNPAGKGFRPVNSSFAQSTQLALAAEMATFVVTAPATGLYELVGLVVSTVATSGTMPTITVTYTDADSGVATSIVLLTGSTTSAAGTIVTGNIFISVKAGGTITFTGTAYATTTYSAKLRVIYLG